MIEFTLWGLPHGSSGRLDEQVLTSTTDKARISHVKQLATAHGWHSFRVQVLDGTPPDFSASLTKARRA